MLLAFLVGCGSPVSGTWMFRVAVTAPVGDECVASVTHNLVGAYEPVASPEDLAWTTESESAQSEQVFFGRVEEGEEGAVLIVGNASLPGTTDGKGHWSFAWTGSETARTTNQHATGYQFIQSVENALTTTLTGTLDGDTMNGGWEEASQTVASWAESDTWSDDAAAYVGATGAIPTGNYLLRLDGTGVEVPATNTQSSYDCGDGSCSLTVNEACSYSYDLTGSRTGFDAADANWTEDAGQPAGL